jgi:hypothetical protein
MNQLKRALGYVLMLVGPVVMIFMFWQAADKIGLAQAQVAAAAGEAAKDLARSTAINTILQWCIIIAVFLPIACGMVIFAKYAIKGEYDHLPFTSADLEN